MRHVLRACALLVLVACGRETTLPDPPAAAPPVVQAFAPARAWARELVEVTGTGFGRSPDDVKVVFGGSAPATPRTVSEDGTRLTVAVPDDATSGELAVVSAHGRGTVAGTFTFRGVGRLALGRETRSTDLRPRLDAAWPVEDGGMVFFARNFGRLSIGARLGVSYLEGTALPLEDVIAAGPAGGHTFAVAASCGTGATCSADDALLVADGPVAEATSVAKWRKAAIPGLQLPFERHVLSTYTIREAPLAATDGADHLALAFERTVWLADLAANPPAVKAFPRTGGERYGAIVAWQGGFAATHEMVVERFDPLQNKALPAIELPGGLPGEAVTAALVDGDRFFVATTADRLLLYRFAGDTPRLAGHYDELPGDAGIFGSSEITAFALSPDGSRLAGAEKSRGAVLTFDVKAEDPVPLGAADVEGAGSILATSGSFLVASVGGVAQLAPATGVRLGTIPAVSALSAAASRTIRCGTGESARDVTVLELASAGFQQLLRLDPDTLQPVPDDCPRPRVPAGTLDGLRTLPATNELLGRVNGTGVLWRISPEAGVDPVPLAGAGGFGIDFDVSADGRWIAARPPTAKGWRILPADGRDFADAVTIAAGSLAFDTKGHAVVATSDRLEVYALEEKGRKLGGVKLDGTLEKLLFDTSPRDDVAFLVRRGAALVLQRFVPATLELTEMPVPAGVRLRSRLVLSPSRAELWDLAWAPNFRVESRPFDPAALLVGNVDLVADLPLVGSDSLVLPDGRIVVFEVAGSDRVVVVE